MSKSRCFCHTVMAFLASVGLTLSLSLSLTALAQDNQPAKDKKPKEDAAKATATETLKAKAATWREASPAATNPSDLTLSASFPDQHWWEQFQDPLLDQYIQEAIKANVNLALAHERIEEARATARQTMGREFPLVTLGGNFTRQHTSSTTRITNVRSGSGSNGAGGSGSGGTTSSGTSGSNGANGAAIGQTMNFYSLPLNVSYELDLWGKNRNRTQAANKQTDAAVRDFQATHVALVTDVANAYFNLTAADQLIRLQQDAIATAERDLQHAQNRYDAGLVDQEDVVLRQGRLTNFKAQLQDLYQLQATALDQMALLMGRTPYEVAELARTHWEQYQIPQEVKAGIPSDLLTRRPDILSAEDQMAASGFLVKAARKELLPSFNLNGQFGFSTVQLGKLLNWDSYIASAGASLLQNLYTGGQARAGLRIFKSRYQQQLLMYRNTILQAFREVDDSLASLKAHRNAYEEYSASLDSLGARLRIQENRVNAGAASEVDIDPVRLEMVQAQQGLARTKLAALTDTISLYKALGGGY
jgi:NodT family efflux transporter outer membrane factor (OMF) lipoprotein